MYTLTHMHTLIQQNAFTYTCKHTSTYTHVDAHIQIFRHTLTCIPIRTHAHTHMHMNTQTSPYAHTYLPCGFGYPPVGHPSGVTSSKLNRVYSCLSNEEMKGERRGE